MLLNEGKLVLRAFFARSPDGRMVLFHYYLLGGDTVAPSGLYARLCHAFLVATKLVAMATSLKISKKSRTIGPADPEILWLRANKSGTKQNWLP